MGRHSVIPRIEFEFQKPIRDVITELASQGDAKYIARVLKISLRSAYNLLTENDIEPKVRERPPIFKAEGELGKLIEDFLIAKEVGGKTKSTLEFYGANLRRFTWWLDYNETPQALKYIDANCIRHFLLYLQNTPTLRFGGYSTSSNRPASRATRDAYWRTFQSFFKWLVKEGKLKESQNPMKLVDRPGQSKTIIPHIETNVIQKILASFNGDFQGKRDRAITLMFWDTGIRLTELSDLQMRDILDDGLLKVFGKGQKERKVHLSPPVQAALNNYITARPNDSSWLWLKYDGDRLTRVGIQSLVRRFERFCPPGVKISPHKFRHTFAVDMLRLTNDPYALKTMGGWADLDMPNMYSASIHQEHAIEVHKKASPASLLLGDGDA